MAATTGAAAAGAEVRRRRPPGCRRLPRRPADAGEDRKEALGLGRAARRAGDGDVGVARELLEALVALAAAVVVDRHRQSMPCGDEMRGRSAESALRYRGGR